MAAVGAALDDASGAGQVRPEGQSRWAIFTRPPRACDDNLRLMSPLPPRKSRSRLARPHHALWLGVLLGAGCTADVPTSPAEGPPAPAEALTLRPAQPEPEVQQIPPVAAVPPALPTPTPSIAQPALPGLLMPLPSTGGAELPRFPTPPPVVEVASVERATPGWELALSFDRAVTLERFQSGVLCNVGGVPHELGPDGALVAKPAADFSKVRPVMHAGHVVGSWPDDAWRFSERWQDRGSSDLVFSKWNGKRWVAQQLLKGRKINESEIDAYHWSPRGGMFMVPMRWHAVPPEGPVQFRRIAGRSPDPKPLVVAEESQVEAAVEAEDGTLYVFVQPQRTDLGLEILRHCDQSAVPGCERTGAVALGRPEATGTHYRTGIITTRGGASISAAVSEYPHRDASGRLYLVHFERGGWTLDAVPGEQPMEVGHLLPVADGSLWIVLDEPSKHTLWHRSPLGRWVAVPLPEHAGPTAQIQIALRDEGHLWMSVNTDDHHAIYSTRAALQSAPG